MPWEEKGEIEKVLLQLFRNIPMDIPINFEEILQFVYNDVVETSNFPHWNDSDVIIGFRRWIETERIKDGN